MSAVREACGALLFTGSGYWPHLSYSPKMPISLLVKTACPTSLLDARPISPADDRGNARETRAPVAKRKPAFATPVEVGAPTPPGEPALEVVRSPTELRHKALLSSLSDLVFVLRKDGVVLDCHFPKDAAPALSVEMLMGKRLMELLPIQIAQQTMHYLEKAVRTGQTQAFLCPFPVANKTRDFEARISRSAPGEAVAVVRDVTARKLAEQEILEITNREQVRIGQDLHDGLGQHLTGVTFLSRALERKLAARELPESEDAAEIGRLVLQALSQTRNLARGIFPVELESRDLAPALRDLASTVEKLFKISCTVESAEGLVIVDRDVVNQLFRLAQEAVNNSVKHGKARRVQISLQILGDKTVLTIRDDGVGFRREATAPKGLGLRIMGYRAQRVGARFDIQRGERGGTIVTCALPETLKKDAA